MRDNHKARNAALLKSVKRKRTSKSIVTPPNSECFPIGGEHVAWVKLTDSQNEQTSPTPSHVIRSNTLKLQANLCVNRRQANQFFAVCRIFEMVGIK